MASLPGVGVASQRLEPPAPPGVWSHLPGVAPSSGLPGVASHLLTAGVSPAASHSDFARFLQTEAKLNLRALVLSYASIRKRSCGGKHSISLSMA